MLSGPVSAVGRWEGWVKDAIARGTPGAVSHELWIVLLQPTGIFVVQLICLR